MENIHAVYNGRFNFLNDIKISPLSRAYTFSDSVRKISKAVFASSAKTFYTRYQF